MIQLLTLLAFLMSLNFNTSTPTFLEDFNAYKSQYKKDLCLGKEKVIPCDDTSYIQHFDFDPNWIIECTIQTFEELDTVLLVTSSQNKKSFIPVAKLSFEYNSAQHHLTVYKSTKGQHYFIPFRDVSSGNETYGGGRYLDISGFNENGMDTEMVTLDFNRAYNPYCAYTVGYNCPIPPIENHLKIKILAGEKNFQK